MNGAPGPIVRVGTLEDAGSIGRLLFEFNREFDEPTPSAAALVDRVTLLLEEGDALFLLAGEGPDGVAVLRFRRSIWSEGLECYLAELSVAPGARGRGTGRAIMGGAISQARRRGADKMDVGVDEPDVAARTLSESLGFSNRAGGPGGPVMHFFEREL